VAVINESMARRFFGNENPIGRRFGLPNGEVEIIGVAKDAKYRNLREQGRPMFYLSFAQPGSDRAQMTLILRTTGDPAPIADALQREARALDPGMPMFQVETLAAQLDASLVQERLVATLSSVFGLLALLLACIGLYGVMAYDVARRTQEIGIRLALGAQGGDVLKLVVKQGMTLVCLGVGFGLLASFALTRLLTNLLFGVSATEPATFAVIGGLLLFVALLACWLPARRAAKVDPLIALRTE
jgi:predicted permease